MTTRRVTRTRRRHMAGSRRRDWDAARHDCPPGTPGDRSGEPYGDSGLSPDHERRAAGGPRPWCRCRRVAARPTGSASQQTGSEDAQITPRKQRSLGSERGLATPSPDGKGEITLGPSKKIMPLDPYSTLGRSCEPAYQVDLPGAGLRGDVTRWLATGRARQPRGELLGHLAGSSPRSSRSSPGPDPVTGGHG